MATIEVKRFDQPDEKRPIDGGGQDKGLVELLRFSEVTVGRIRLDPGWRWSKDVKPIMGTESCLAAHTNLVLSGRLHVRMDDGQEVELGAGDVAVIPPGHDAWTVGDQPCIVLDFSGIEDYAKRMREAEERPSIH